MINLNKYICKNVDIPLAKQGEYGQQICFDYSCWVKKFGSGSVGWTYQRSADVAGYLILHTDENDITTVTLSETETAYAGRGYIEIFYINDGETEKRISQIFPFVIEPTMEYTNEAPPAWESYIEAVHKDAEKIANMNADGTVSDEPGEVGVMITKEETDTELTLHFAFEGLIPDLEYDPETAIMTISYGGIILE